MAKAAKRNRANSVNLWMAVTADEFELPLLVADSAAELGEKLGVSASTIYSVRSRNENRRVTGVKFVKVRVSRNGIE